MIHFLPDLDTATAVDSGPTQARLAGLGHALAVVEPLAGEPRSIAHPALLGGLAVPADVERLIDDLSTRAASASVAGLEAIAALRDAGRDANPAAVRRLADSIRDTLDEVGALLSL